MKIKCILLNWLLLATLLLLSQSCMISEEEELPYFLAAEDYTIQVNCYGGLVGMMTTNYYLKKDRNGFYVQTGIEGDKRTLRIDSFKKDTLGLFIQEAFKTNEPNKKMIASCIGLGGTEYILKRGFVQKNLKPSDRCDTLFFSVIQELVN